MTRRSWIRNVINSRSPRTIRKTLTQHRRVLPYVECLEDRQTPATINVGPTTTNLIAAIDTADHTPRPVTLVLPTNTTYLLTMPDNSNVNAEDNNWYGPNSLPAIDNNITIQGNGSTIQRAAGSPAFRLF